VCFVVHKVTSVTSELKRAILTTLYLAGAENIDSLGLDHCLGDVGYVEPHELECPLGDLPMVRWIPIISSSPYKVITRIRWLSK
jgi:hypothetical protein